MRILLLAPATHHRCTLALAQSLRAYGHAVQVSPSHDLAQAVAGADVVLADPTLLHLAAEAARVVLLLRDAALPEPLPKPQGFRAAIATSERAAGALSAAGVPARQIALLPTGVPEVERPADPPAGAACVVLATEGDRPMVEHALARLPDLDHALLILEPDDCGAGNPAAWQQAGVLALVDTGADAALLMETALAFGVPLAVAGAAAPMPADYTAMVKQDDVAGLSVALRRFIFDPPLRRRMAEAAWQHGRDLPRRTEQARLLTAVLEQAL